MISLVVLLLVLILVIVACWISSNNCCNKNKHHICLLEARVETGFATLQAAQTVCCTKAFLTTVGGGTVDRLGGSLKVITWDALTMNELPDAGWTPVFSTIDSSLIGWTVPLSGTYAVQYNTVIATDVCAAVMIVNGQVLLRSLSANASTLTAPQQISQTLSKSYIINLEKNDVVSVVIFNLSGPGITPPVPTGGPGRYLHTLNLDLRDASSLSADQGIDANPTPIILLDKNLLPPMGHEDPVLPSKAVAQNVEQWSSSSCVQNALTTASNCAVSATTVSEQFSCIDSLLTNLAVCGLAL